VGYGWKTAAASPTNELLLPVVMELLPAGRVLDLGCGNGALTSKLPVSVGVDQDADGIAIARGISPATRFVEEVAEPGLLARIGEDPFDGVVSLEVVEHVYDPHAWATCCFESLRPGGRLICSTPYHGYLKNLAISLAGGWDAHWHPLRTGGHIKFWSAETLTELLSVHGFAEISVRGVGRVRPLWWSMVVTAIRP
jgi:2-polyprenyl-3-methyl-5-hydroxy-6-metoxy-1,4-benzoquinol methylase